MRGTDITVVMPLYCEGVGLGESLARVRQVLDALPCTADFLLVDDGSTDNTWDVVKAICAEQPGVNALRLSRNFGKEAAVSAGLERANGRAVIVMDGDLQHPPDMIPEMVRLWAEEGYDVVDAVKERRGRESLLRKAGAGVFYMLMSHLTGFDLDGASDYKLLDHRVVEAWRQMGESQVFYRAMTEWLGFRHARIPFCVGDRNGGKSRWSIMRLLRLFLTALGSFSSLPLHLVTLLGGLFLIGGVVLAIRALYMWFTGDALEGFTTVILLEVAIGSILMISLGIIGEYVAQLYCEVKRRPRYVVMEDIPARARPAVVEALPRI